jgi:predicted ATPase
VDSYVSKYSGADRLLHYGSKETQKNTVELDSSNKRHLAAYYGYAVDDNLTGDIENDGVLAGVTMEGGFIDRAAPSFRRYQFHDTGFHSPLKKTNQIDDNRFLRSDGSNLAAFLYLLRERYSDSYKSIRQTVQQVAPFFGDFQLEPLALNPDTIKLEWRHKNSDQYFNASAFSDGTLRFIALATLFLQPVELRPSVILVDEPELGLHPYTIGLLASLIRETSQETQVIAATQSSLLLDYFDPGDVLVADLVDDATVIRRLEAERLAEWLKDYSLGQLWEKGELEEIPVNE